MHPLALAHDRLHRTLSRNNAHVRKDLERSRCLRNYLPWEDLQHCLGYQPLGPFSYQGLGIRDGEIISAGSSNIPALVLDTLLFPAWYLAG